MGSICTFSREEMETYESEQSSPDQVLDGSLGFFTPHPCNTITLDFLKQTTSHIAGEPGQRKSFHFTEG